MIEAMSLDDLLIEMGADPLMTGAAPDALRRITAEKEEKRLAAEILATSPQLLRGWKAWPEVTAVADTEGRVVITLPDDFLMLLSIRLTGWERPAREVLSPDNWLYKLQSYRWESLRGSPARPLAFFTTDDEGHPALELFSSEPGTVVSIAEGRYMPRPKVS